MSLHFVCVAMWDTKDNDRILGSGTGPIIRNVLSTDLLDLRESIAYDSGDGCIVSSSSNGVTNPVDHGRGTAFFICSSSLDRRAHL